MKVAELWHLSNTHVPAETTEILPVDKSVRGRIRKFAYENAITFVFLVLTGFITWFFLILVNAGVLKA